MSEFTFNEPELQPNQSPNQQRTGLYKLLHKLSGGKLNDPATTLMVMWGIIIVCLLITGFLYLQGTDDGFTNEQVPRNPIANPNT